MIKFDIETTGNEQAVNITDNIRKAVQELGITDGTVTVFLPHTSCGLTITENCDPHVLEDLLRQLRMLVPLKQTYYKHNGGNSDAHIKSSILGNSHQLIVKGGALQLGFWQGVFLCEFDGPRIRHIWVR